MIRQVRSAAEEEKDAKVSELIQKGTKITQDFEELIRQQLVIHQDIVQRHEDISKKGNEKALFNLAVEQIKTHERKIEQMQELYDRQKELAQ